MGMHHTFGQFEGSGPLICAFKILDTSGTPTIVNISPPSSQTADLAITDTGAGIYDVVITNFKGPAGSSHVQATPYITSTMATCSARSYSGQDLSITIRIEDDASTLTDSSVDVLVLAW